MIGYNLYIIKFSNFKNIDFKLFLNSRITLIRYPDFVKFRVTANSLILQNLKAKEEEGPPTRSTIEAKYTLSG